MLYFQCDYAEGCHPNVLKALEETNLVSTPGYGNDEFCEKAKEKIKEYIHCPNADVYFLVGGTQTNQTVIDSMLQNYDGVIAASTGHVSVHEAGAIEYSGHKVITLPEHQGKISSDELKQFLVKHYEDNSSEHMVNPGMVYISYPTEYGTLYSKEELQLISSVCKEYQIPLYIDGARLAYGLAAANDLRMEDIADLCDVFYIGGTKVGALFGEAVVFTKGNAPKHMVTQIKQHGALLAKGRLLGVQFDALFTDDLYMQMGSDGVKWANIIRDELKQKGYQLYMENPTNQIFVVMDNSKIKQLEENVCIDYWEKLNETHTVIRIATSWATSEEDVLALKKFL